MQALLARWSLWLHQTKWRGDIVDQIASFPISGDGKLCGTKLVETLEEHKLKQEQEEAMEVKSSPRGGVA